MVKNKIVFLFFCCAGCTIFAPVSEDFNGSSISIAAGITTISTINITAGGSVDTFNNVKIYSFAYPNAEDLTSSMLSPKGTEVILVQNQGADANYNGNYVFVSDSSGDPSIDVHVGEVVPDTYRCQGDFDDFADESVTGNWRLKIENVGTSTGAISSWSFNLTYKQY